MRVYLWERGTEVFSYDTYCLYHSSSTECTTANYCENNPTDEICNATRNTSWVGEVALMYPSDQYLVYANGVDALCYYNPNQCWFDKMGTRESGNPTEGWINNSNEMQNIPQNNWFVSPFSSDSFDVFVAETGGQLFYSESIGFAPSGIRPVVYLSSNVKIIDGTGEQNNPYKLGL